jgi:hypothetical protein
LKKLRVKRNFKPASVNDGDELFRNGIFIFNITKILEHIRSNPNEFTVEPISIGGFRIFEPSNLEEASIASADLSKSIILAEISPGKMNVIDGNHRLEKAFREKVDQLPSYSLRAEQHIAFLTSVEAYKEYVSYWNGKITN